MRKRLPKGEAERIANRIRPTSLPDFVYELRRRANYESTDEYGAEVADADIRRLHDGMELLLDTGMLVVETQVACRARRAVRCADRGMDARSKPHRAVGGRAPSAATDGHPTGPHEPRIASTDRLRNRQRRSSGHRRTNRIADIHRPDLGEVACSFKPVDEVQDVAEASPRQRGSPRIAHPGAARARWPIRSSKPAGRGRPRWKVRLLRRSV
jgi:hypothetical protein